MFVARSTYGPGLLTGEHANALELRLSVVVGRAYAFP